MFLVSLNFDKSQLFFPNFGQGPFPKIAGKSPVSSHSKIDKTKILMKMVANEGRKYCRIFNTFDLH